MAVLGVTACGMSPARLSREVCAIPLTPIAVQFRRLVGSIVAVPRASRVFGLAIAQPCESSTLAGLRAAGGWGYHRLLVLYGDDYETWDIMVNSALLLFKP